MVDKLQITIRDELVADMLEKWKHEHPYETDMKPTQIVKRLIVEYMNSDKIGREKRIKHRSGL